MNSETLSAGARVCLCCGKPFSPKKSTQKYCSEACRRKYLRHHESEHPADAGCPVLRFFHCRRYGTAVAVRSVRDNRRAFCCSHCERLYWKHRHAAPREEVSNAQPSVL